MKKIGGYFELELDRGNIYHPSALALNSGRNAFEYILRAKNYKKVYLPYYTCDAMIQPLSKLSIPYQMYRIDENFIPIFDFDVIGEDEAFVYNNYFGLMDEVVRSVVTRCKNTIIDSAQSFYSKHLPGVDTFYSSRKFFGVPDGAYLYTDKRVAESLSTEKSYDKAEHLLRRIDESPESGYPFFADNESKFTDYPIRNQSELTGRILENIDYKSIAIRRRENFQLLNEGLGKLNRLKIELNGDAVPMVYPLLCKNQLQHECFYNEGVYVAKYWPNVLEWTDRGTLEYDLAENIIPLPIDQRYGPEEMKHILDVVRKLVS